MCDQAKKLISHNIVRQKIGKILKGIYFSIDNKQIWSCK